MSFTLQQLEKKSNIELEKICRQNGIYEEGKIESPLLVQKIMDFQKKKTFPFSDYIKKYDPEQNRQKFFRSLEQNHGEDTGITLEGNKEKLIWINKNNLEDNKVFEKKTGIVKTIQELAKNKLGRQGIFLIICQLILFFKILQQKRRLKVLPSYLQEIKKNIEPILQNFFLEPGIKINTLKY